MDYVLRPHSAYYVNIVSGKKKYLFVNLTKFVILYN
jgi:hypothetical protein